MKWRKRRALLLFNVSGSSDMFSQQIFQHRYSKKTAFSIIEMYLLGSPVCEVLD